MNKIRVIDLLNKIAKGEEVPSIKYRDKILHWNKEKDRFEDKDGMNTLYEMDFSELNEEVEIIEEEKKIPEELPTWFSLEKDCENDNIQYANYNFERMYEKINEICDYLKSKGDE